MIERKIGILTLSGYRNYGNVLQNLALQNFLMENGFDSETIWCISKANNDSKMKKIKSHLKNRDLISTLGYQFKMRFIKRYKALESQLGKREEVFKKFCELNISYSKYRINTNMIENDYKYLAEVNRFYNTFLVGSDQVWGLQGKGFPDVYFLPFADPDKRNSFAASFGFSEIPDKTLISNYRKSILKMNNISVREKDAQNIIHSIANKDSELILDPVFLLSLNKWKSFESNDGLNIKGKFILTYFLGKKTNRYVSIIDRLSKKKKLKIINLNDIDDTEYFTISPANFLYLFDNASYIVTDSFHGTAFSIIFKKPFITVEREGTSVNMNSRIISLLNMTKLSNCFITSNSRMKKDFNIDDMPNYNVSNELIRKNKNKAYRFVNKVLK